MPAPWETGCGGTEASAVETETGRGGVAAPASDWVPASERGGGRLPQRHRRLLHLRCRPLQQLAAPSPLQAVAVQETKAGTVAQPLAIACLAHA